MHSPRQQATAFSDTTLGGIVWAIFLGLVVVAAIFAITTFRALNADPNQAEIARTEYPRRWLNVMFVDAMFGPDAPARTEVRIEQRGGYNVIVWAKRTDFERIAFPDRKGFIENAGKLWCSNVPTNLLPSLWVRDLQTGADLGSYGCTLSVANIY